MLCDPWRCVRQPFASQKLLSCSMEWSPPSESGHYYRLSAHEYTTLERAGRTHASRFSSLSSRRCNMVGCWGFWLQPSAPRSVGFRVMVLDCERGSFRRAERRSNQDSCPSIKYSYDNVVQRFPAQFLLDIYHFLIVCTFMLFYPYHRTPGHPQDAYPLAHTHSDCQFLCVVPSGSIPLNPSIIYIERWTKHVPY